MKHDEVREAIEKLLKPVLPNGYFQTLSSTSGGSSNNVFAVEPIIKNANWILKDSRYDFQLDHKNEFIHFTTLKNAINIINENAIRLYDLNNLDDPQELLFSAKLFQGRSLDQKEIKNLKSCLFSFSLIRHSNDFKENEYQFWQLYGERGKGAALLFTIDSSNQYLWENTYIGKLLYGEEDLEPIRKFIAEYEELEKAHKFLIGNPYKSLAPILCLHKSEIYKFEEEIRLFKYLPKPSYQHHADNEVMLDVSRNFSETYFIKQPIREQHNKTKVNSDVTSIKESNINIRLSKILIGPRYNTKEFEQLKGILIHACERNGMGEVVIDQSPFSKFFNWP